MSLNTPENHVGEIDYAAAASVARQVAEAVIHYGLPHDTLVNVNVPYMPEAELRNIQITRQGLRLYHDRVDKRIDPRGRPYYWVIGDTPTEVLERGTDVGALAEGFVSITPVQLDLTAYRFISDLNAWNWKNGA